SLIIKPLETHSSEVGKAQQNSQQIHETSTKTRPTFKVTPTYNDDSRAKPRFQNNNDF
ncbi:2231_t:CDS:2, partial [Dentiscutata erythropus]